MVGRADAENLDQGPMNFQASYIDTWKELAWLYYLNWENKNKKRIKTLKFSLTMPKRRKDVGEN